MNTGATFMHLQSNFHFKKISIINYFMSFLGLSHLFLEQVSLSSRAEKVLEEIIQGQTKGDAFYFWTHLNVNDGPAQKKRSPTFWSMCDILNGGNCRYFFSVFYFYSKISCRIGTSVYGLKL